MNNNQGYLIIKFDHEDGTVFVEDKELMSLISNAVDIWTKGNDCPFRYARLISDRPFDVISSGDWFDIYQLSHSANYQWQLSHNSINWTGKGIGCSTIPIPTLNIPVVGKKERDVPLVGIVTDINGVDGVITLMMLQSKRDWWEEMKEYNDYHY
jgi:hypothetical protein